MTDVLIQTRIPKSLGKWILGQANVSGETVAAWLRRLLVREMAKARVHAWVRSIDRCDPAVLAANPVKPNYVLERIRLLDGDEAIYTLIDADRAVPVSKEGWRQTEWFKNPGGYRFVLEGSPQPWWLMSASFNLTAQRIEVALAVDHEYGSRTGMSKDSA